MSNGFEWILVRVYHDVQDSQTPWFLSQLVCMCESKTLPMLVGDDFDIIRQREEKNISNFTARLAFCFQFSNWRSRPLRNSSLKASCNFQGNETNRGRSPCGIVLRRGGKWEPGVDRMARVASALPAHQGSSPRGLPWCSGCFFYKTKSIGASACWSHFFF
jgi:hypothetical protein